MIKLNILQNLRAVKKFVLRCSEGLEGAMGIVKTCVYQSKGEVVYEKRITDSAIFCIATFESYDMMIAWEALAPMKLGVATQGGS